MAESPPDSFQNAVGSLERARAEHREILLQVAMDAGMEGETRRQLIEHILAEEDEKVAALASFVAAPAPRSAQGPGLAPEAQSAAPGLTVGSLRRTVDGRPASRGTVGSLRPSLERITR